MMVAEHHVGHVGGGRAVLGQLGQQRLAGGDHAGVDDDDRVAVHDQGDGAGHPLVVAVAADVAVVQDVHGGGSTRGQVQVSHGADLTGQGRSKGRGRPSTACAQRSSSRSSGSSAMILATRSRRRLMLAAKTSNTSAWVTPSPSSTPASVSVTRASGT